MVTGEYDYLSTPAVSLATAEKIKGADFKELAGLGHSPMSENHDRKRPMLFMVRVRLTKPERMTNRQFYELWLKEAEAATLAQKSGVVKGLWKVSGLPDVIGVLDVESHDALDGAILSLPLWNLGYSHVVTSAEVTPLRPYESWYEDLKKLSTQ